MTKRVVNLDDDGEDIPSAWYRSRYDVADIAIARADRCARRPRPQAEGDEPDGA